LHNAQLEAFKGDVRLSDDQARAQLDRVITGDLAAFQRGLGLAELDGFDPIAAAKADPALITADPAIVPDPAFPPDVQRFVTHLPLGVTRTLQGGSFGYDAIERAYLPQLVGRLDDREEAGFRAFVGTPGRPGCIACHNLPGTLGGGSTPFEDVHVSEENALRLPTVTFTVFSDAGVPSLVTTADPGMGGRTGVVEDVNKFKIPGLIGIRSRRRFFHDNHERSLGGVIGH
jgi:hypothetical protein